MIIPNQFNRICRTCLVPEINEDTCSYLHTIIELENGDSLEISNIIGNCLNLEVTNDQYMPQIICNKCISIIRDFYVFRHNCHKNDKHLREQVRASLKNKVKTDETIPSVIIQLKSIEKVEIPELTEIDFNGQDDFEKTNGNFKKEINIFEDCPDDILCDDSNNNFDNGYEDSNFEIANPDEADKSCKIKASSKEISSGDEEEINEEQKTFHKCDICFEMFDNRKELLFHRRANHINEISEEYYTVMKKDNKTHYICKICNRFCKHKDILRVHLRSHTGEKPYKCAVCSQSFAQKWHSRKHMKIHNLETIEKKPAIFYKCGSCKEGFESEIAVKIHYEQHHPPNNGKNKIRVLSKPIGKLCDICGKFMKDLTEHLRWHAGKRKKKHECKICGRVLTTSSSLSKHRQRHSDEKKFVCDTCGKSFKTKPDLTLHRKIHFEERKHECQLCGRKFLHNNRLRIHLRVHAGEKPYQVYDNRKKEKRRLQRKEKIKNGILSSETQPVKEKRKNYINTNKNS